LLLSLISLIFRRCLRRDFMYCHCYSSAFIVSLSCFYCQLTWVVSFVHVRLLIISVCLFTLSKFSNKPVVIRYRRHHAISGGVLYNHTVKSLKPKVGSTYEVHTTPSGLSDCAGEIPILFLSFPQYVIHNIPSGMNI